MQELQSYSLARSIKWFLLWYQRIKGGLKARLSTSNPHPVDENKKITNGQYEGDQEFVIVAKKLSQLHGENEESSPPTKCSDFKQIKVGSVGTIPSIEGAVKSLLPSTCGLLELKT